MLLAGAIAAHASRVLMPPELAADYAAAVERMPMLVREALPLIADAEELAVAISALAAAEGCFVLGREVLAFMSGELEVECPHCYTDLVIETDTVGGELPRDADELDAMLVLYRDLSRRYRQEHFAEWIDSLRREIPCPSCGADFVLAKALDQ